MDLEKLAQSPAGRLVEISGTDPKYGHYRHSAFVPNPLPETFDLGTEAWNAAAAAMEAIGRLRQACFLLPNPELLIAPSLAQEAVATSALEGTYGALSDLLEARLPELKPKSSEVVEIRGYEHMAHAAFGWIAERPLSVGLICDLQMILRP